MNGSRKSDGLIVPRKPSNKDDHGVSNGASTSAEGVEERRPTKGNPDQQTRYRTQSRARLQSAPGRIRQALSACASDPR